MRFVLLLLVALSLTLTWQASAAAIETDSHLFTTTDNNRQPSNQDELTACLALT